MPLPILKSFIRSGEQEVKPRAEQDGFFTGSPSIPAQSWEPQDHTFNVMVQDN